MLQITTYLMSYFEPILEYQFVCFFLPPPNHYLLFDSSLLSAFIYSIVSITHPLYTNYVKYELYLKIKFKFAIQNFNTK